MARPIGTTGLVGTRVMSVHRLNPAYAADLPTDRRRPVTLTDDITGSAAGPRPEPRLERADGAASARLSAEPGPVWQPTARLPIATVPPLSAT